MSARPGLTLIRGARVLGSGTAADGSVCDLHLADGHIVAMAPKLSGRGVAQCIEAAGLVAMPGMVQAHTHLCQTLWRGQADDLELLDWLQQQIWPMEAALDAPSLAAAARLGMAELLLGGTTAVLDMGTVHHTEALFTAAAAMGLRYTGGKTIMDQGHTYPSVLKETAAAALSASDALCDRWHGAEGGRLRYAYAPRFALSCSAEVLRGCAASARARGARLHTHAAENTEEVALVRQRTGMGNVAYLHSLGCTGADSVLAHCIWIDAQEQQVLRQTGTHVVHCPSSNLKLASGIARIDAYLAQGIALALGADGAACNNSLDAFAEMRLMALLHRTRGGPGAVPAARALDIATRGGARALGLERTGLLAPGYTADILLLDLHRPHVCPSQGDLTSRVVYAARSSDVHSVLVAGELLVAEGTLCRQPQAAIRNAADAAATGLRARMRAQAGESADA